MADSDTGEAGSIQVYDVNAGKMITVTLAEAAAGLVRYGRSLGPGTPECAVWEDQAVRVARGEVTLIRPYRNN